LVFAWAEGFALTTLVPVVDPTKLELVASAMRGRYEGLQDFSGTCKTPANENILTTTHFPASQEIYSGCCTVAAQPARFARTQGSGCSLCEQPGGHLCELRFRGFLRSPRTRRLRFSGDIRLSSGDENPDPRSILLGSLFCVVGSVLEERYERLDDGSRLRHASRKSGSCRGSLKVGLR
jgi:hypothetical protein